MSDTTRKRIRDFLERRIPRFSPDDTQDIFAHGSVNSLFAMELVIFVEKEFDITVSNEELTLHNFRSVATMTALVDRVTAPAGKTG